MFYFHISRNIPENVRPYSQGCIRNLYSFCCAPRGLYAIEKMPSLNVLEKRANQSLSDTFYFNCCWFFFNDVCYAICRQIYRLFGNDSFTKIKSGCVDRTGYNLDLEMIQSYFFWGRGRKTLKLLCNFYTNLEASI